MSTDNSKRVLVGSTLFGMTSHYTMRLREVVVEKEALRLQNIALRKKIENHETFREVLRSVSQLKDDKEKFMPVHQNDEGWWVHFPNNAPSFYFNPFSAEQIGATSNPLDYKFPVNQQAIGNFFGWEIYRALPEAHSAHVRFTKSVQCSLDTAYKVAAMREQDLRPLLRTPEDWSFTKRSEISTQILQR
ncbi:unnamed protein product [Phytophthora lilii]|uniref:Unnamed protein product n=1 Tax=Phytophthora lilii TaxID=2077276 RepID=A0A9W6XEX6_9STRA|nr:unnamed protein product [Phytophthora lilii]